MKLHQLRLPALDQPQAWVTPPDLALLNQLMVAKKETPATFHLGSSVANWKIAETS